ncbi:MAG TPA: hypothetical protein VEB43_12720 [Anaeromyxobacter sp.]|nr:hypothetical protein [Anaeromyxobacter sp.]
MRLHKNPSVLVLSALAVLTFPLRSDGGPECDNATTSLQSTLNNPVAGDEKFFTLPVGPSNVMFLLDVSGSMQNVPQCGDAGTWGDTGALATCKWPTNWGTPISNPAPGAVSEEGTCTVSATTNPNLAWMANYTPTTRLVDEGLGTATNGLVDRPPWGTGCTGNNCLFQAEAVYADQSWNETSATPSTPCTVEFTYQDWDCTTPSNAVQVTRTFRATLPNCSACLTNTPGKGFYFSRAWRAAYSVRNTASTSGGGRRCSSGSTTYYVDGGAQRAYFTGGWLNANPPKFMSARKVIKEVAWIDPAVSAATDQLRLGLTYFSTALTNSARIIVPLGPSASDSYPVNPPKYVTARQYILDALNHTHSTLNADGTLAAAGLPGWPAGVTPPSLIDGGTPMASALFRVGQYFTQPGTYTARFGSTYELTAFRETSAGVMLAPWVNATTNTICWSCQKSATIIVTDGSPNSEMTFPTALQTYAQNVYTNTNNCSPGTSCSTTANPRSKCCSPSDSTSNPPSRLPRVAAWLHDNDLSPSRHNGSQTLTISAVSFGLPEGNARTILQATANMGGGMYNNAADGDALAAGVAQAVSAVSNTSTSFGAPAATALTTINAADTKAFITRFRPNQKATWEGHLHQWMLFDEAAAGCDPTKKPDPDDPSQQVVCRGKTVLSNFDGDTRDGYNLCTKSFLVDADCDEVVEDSSTGLWYKKGTGAPGIPAKKFWDAGEVLSTPTATGYRTAAEPADAGNIAPYTQYAPGKTPRNLWTALPDGRMYELTTKNAAVLAPYMNLDQAWCASFESLAKLCGAAPLPACPVTVAGNWKTYCAQQVILFARGWDVMDQDSDGCGGPGYGIAPPAGVQPHPGNGTGAGSNRVASGVATADCTITTSGTTRYGGEERDRENDFGASGSNPAPTFWKLGDIFHSSPVLVHAPTSDVMCRLGVDNQCVRTLFGYTSNPKYTANYQTGLQSYEGCKPEAGEVNAYRKWRSVLADRRNVVLVGSNSGFLHAFDAGGPNTEASTHNRQDLDCVWSEVQDGTGEEVWGFTPPDLLPRLRDTLMNHQYMVDGNIMVRDVWVDGAPADGSTNNPVPGGDPRDGVKQVNEFRTIAIFGERSGGTQFTALDVTNAFGYERSARPRPTFRWSFPPPRSEDAQYKAQSWVDSSPRPPPIGPVRLKADAGDPDPQEKGWIEKWIVMLNGGYDPTLNRGRAVWTVDAWTGQVYWRFDDTVFKREVLGNATRDNTSMFPVAAGIGMVDIGDPTGDVGLDSDNFFDTATWGDLGGNLWVARFDWPGERDASGRVTNWRAARTFEQGRLPSDDQYATNRSEFFYMTSNAWEPQRHQLRTLLGSGNREQILEQGQGCGPDNLMSCCQAGCSVATSTQVNYGVCSSSGAFACTNTGRMTSSPAFDQGCGTAGASACTGGATNTFTSTSNYSLSCGASGSSIAAGKATCDATGLCAVNPVGTGKDLVPPGAASCTNKAKFYGVWSYGGYQVPEKTFSTEPTAGWASATTFDRNRFTDVDYDGCTFTQNDKCSLVETTRAQVSAEGRLTCRGVTKCQASVDDPGWFYTYNVTCPTEVECSAGCSNEKTVSGSTVVNSCTMWNSFIPRGSALSGSNPCQGANTAQQTAIGYSSDYVTGVPTLSCSQGKSTADNVVYRGSQRTTIAPPAAPMARNSVTRGGKIYYSTLQLDPGAPATSTGSGSRDAAAPLYWTEVPLEVHMCRHVSNASCQ